MEKALAEDFSLENLESYLLDKGFTVDISQVYDIQNIEEKYNVSDIKEIGYIRLKQLVVFAIKIDNLTERTSKKNQFDIAKRLLDKYLKFYGLFVFYDDNKNFRLSFVFKTTHGTKVTYSHYKRFTFYVSPNLPNKTFINQLKDCDFTDLNSIKQAFSTQPITRDFYNDLQNWYYYAIDKVQFPDDYKYSNDSKKDREIRNAQSLIRLLTRLMFIWFLKEKGLVTSNLFDEKELKKIVKDFGKGNNYYNAILQNLFFATLNRPIEERCWAEDKGFLANKKDFGVKSLYRYEDKFLISKEEVLKLFEDIPFINGGLFDCLDKDEVYIDGFSRNEKKQAEISDELFFSEEKTVDLSKYGLGKNVEVRGLINILKSYNFTTDEATPIDQEIALDPELLGKVFENLLASYNPETNTTARKATGSYYTPREIVDYMVEESLREYLKTKVPEAEDKFDDLFSYSDEDLNISDDLKRKLIEAIDQIKIIDPACGSGAFPMGILHKLVFLLQKLDPENETWKEIQLERASKEADEVFRTEKDKQEREKLLEEINESFDESINYPDYARKLYLIENCIYGVDIQPIAIQISKLRFFISLILDQKVDISKPNFGILTLPNLETKFISANALVSLEKPKDVMYYFYEPIIPLEQELKFLRHRYFRIKTKKEKEDLQKKDKELRKQIADFLKNKGWSVDMAENITSFDLFDQNASADWFDPEWMFGVVDGFDIVIGNPPHGADIKKYKDYIEDHYRFYETRKNSASLFIEKGFNLLKEKGILSYVIPKSITYVDSWERTRKVVYKENKLLTLIDISKAFENVRLEQVILISQKIKEKPYFYKAGDFWNDNIEIINDVNSEIIEKLEILPIYIDEIKLEILNKLMQDSIKLYNISETFRGLPFQRKISDTGYPILRGKNINKYQIYREIDKVKLTTSELNSARVKKYMRTKIISQNIVAHVMKPFDRIIIMATYDKEGYLTLDTVMNTFLKDKSFSYEYILGILNSRLAEWFYYWFVYNRAIRTMHFDESYLGKLPIKKINSKNQPIVDQIIQKVDQILTLTQSEDYDTNQAKQKHVKRLEHEIDQFVYQLYDLTDEEIKIIKNSHKKET